MLIFFLVKGHLSLWEDAQGPRPFQLPGPPGGGRRTTSRSVWTQIQALRVRECRARSASPELRPAPTEAAPVSGAAPWPGGEESGPGDPSSGGLGLPVPPPRNSRGPKCAFRCFSASPLDEPPAGPPPSRLATPGTIRYLLLNAEGIHPGLKCRRSLCPRDRPVVIYLHFEFPSKAHLSLPRRSNPPPPMNTAAAFPRFKPGWKDHNREGPNSSARFPMT